MGWQGCRQGMTDQESYEILHRSISVGYIMVPEPYSITEINATVICPDGSLLSFSSQLHGKHAGPQEIDAEIVRKAREIHEQGGEDVYT
jgi:hypothetical protein